METNSKKSDTVRGEKSIPIGACPACKHWPCKCGGGGSGGGDDPKVKVQKDDKKVAELSKGQKLTEKPAEIDITDALPNEVALTILENLSLHQHGIISRVSKSLNLLSADSGYWNQFLLEDYQNLGNGIAKGVFLANVMARKPEHRLRDRFGKNYVLNLVLNDQGYDSVSKILRDESTPQQQEVLNEIVDRLAQAHHSSAGYHNLLSQAVRAFIASGQLTMDDAIALSFSGRCYGRYNLESKAVRAFIASGQLTMDDAIALPITGRCNLESKVVRAFIASSQLTMDDAIALSSDELWNLESKVVQAFIASSQLTMDDAIALSITGRSNLESKVVQAFIASGQLTLDDAIALPITGRSNGRYNLESKAVQAFIASGKLTMDDAIALPITGRSNLDSQAVQEFIASGKLTMDDAIALSMTELDNLESQAANNVGENEITTHGPRSINRSCRI